jgi:hypothetical protein
VGSSTTVAEEAVVQGFTTALRRLHRGTTTLAMPFRLQVARAAAEAAAAAARREVSAADPVPNDVVTAFRRLPQRWRAALWLTAAEGGSPAQVAPVLTLSAEATVSMVTRAAIGLRERYMRLSGRAVDDVRDLVPALRALVVAAPENLEVAATARWQAWQDELVKDERHGLRAIVPFAWAERAVAGAAAGVFAAGIAVAIALSSGHGDSAPQLAAPASADQGVQSQYQHAGNQATFQPLTVASSPLATGSTGSMFAPDLSMGGGRSAALPGTQGGSVSTLAATEPAIDATASSDGVAPGSSSPSSGSTSPSPTFPGAPPTTSAPQVSPQSAQPGVTASGNVGGTPVVAGGSSSGGGATVGSNTVGTPPTTAPSSGTTVVVQTGVLPPITITVP